MATMNISLTDQMKDWVEAQVASGLYANSSEVMRDLVRKEQIKQEKIAQLRLEIQKGFDSGISTRTMDDIISSGLKRARDKQTAAE